MKSKALVSRKAAKDFTTFVSLAFFEVEGRLLGSQMYVYYICYQFKRLINGDFRRMLVNLPGRHLKTFIGSICYPAFLLGIDPSIKIMIVAYDEDLAAEISSQIRDIVMSDWYQKIFATRIADGYASKRSFKTTAGGRVKAVSANGAVTGRGSDVVVYDDPHNAKDWNSPRKLEQVKQQFQRLLTRRDNPAKHIMVVICHRISEDDVSAFILKRTKRPFHHVCLPLIATKTETYDVGHADWRREKGTPLQPDNYPPDVIEELREIEDGPSFWMHYQQGRGRDKSDRIEVDDFQYFNGMSRGLPCVISVDTALKNNPDGSRNVIHVYETDGTKHHLIAMFAQVCDFIDLKKQLIKWIGKYRPSAILIEDTARGPTLIEAIGKRGKYNVIAFSPHLSKRERLRKHSKTIRRGCIYLNANLRNIEDVAMEVACHGSAPYDDHLDTLTQFLSYMATNPVLSKPLIEPRAFVAVMTARGFNNTVGSPAFRPPVQEPSLSRATLHPLNEPYSGPGPTATVIFGGPGAPLSMRIKAK